MMGEKPDYLAWIIFTPIAVMAAVMWYQKLSKPKNETELWIGISALSMFFNLVLVCVIFAMWSKNN